MILSDDDSIRSMLQSNRWYLSMPSINFIKSIFVQSISSIDLKRCALPIFFSLLRMVCEDVTYSFDHDQFHPILSISLDRFHPILSISSDWFEPIILVSSNPNDSSVRLIYERRSWWTRISYQSVWSIKFNPNDLTVWLIYKRRCYRWFNPKAPLWTLIRDALWGRLPNFDWPQSIHPIDSNPINISNRCFHPTNASIRLILPSYPIDSIDAMLLRSIRFARSESNVLVQQCSERSLPIWFHPTIRLIEAIFIQSNPIQSIQSKYSIWTKI